MNIRTAVAVEVSRQAFVGDLQGVLDDVTPDEGAQDKSQQFTAKRRFEAIGDRIIALSDKSETSGDARRVEKYSGTVNLDAEGYAVELSAERGRVNASFQPWAFHQVEARWITDDESGIPLAVEKITYGEVSSYVGGSPAVTPRTLGMLSLLEQSLDTAELARGVLAPVAVAEA